MMQLFVQSLAAGALLTALCFAARAVARRRRERQPVAGRPLTCVQPLDVLGP